MSERMNKSFIILPFHPHIHGGDYQRHSLITGKSFIRGAGIWGTGGWSIMDDDQDMIPPEQGNITNYIMKIMGYGPEYSLIVID